jgi:N-acylneuraminate cytidylyltransferase
MGNICIIPARGGSKRIPKKNIKLFHGKPIIAYSIEYAIASGIFDEVMVSTDSEEIAEISRNYGANVPFLRSSKNANDFAGIAEVLIEVLEKYNNRFDICGCVLPTAPLLNPARIVEANNLISTNNFDCVFSVLEYTYPIQRSLKLQENKAFLNNKEYYNVRSQDLEPMYHDAGQFYLIKTDILTKQKKLYTNNSGAIILNHMEAQDIDTQQDWDLALIKYQLNKEKN